MKTVRSQPVSVYTVILCLSAFVVLLCCAHVTAAAATSKQPRSEIEKLFKAGRYEEIVARAQRVDGLSDREQLLVAKSYGKLRFYHRANRVLKVLYNGNTGFKDFIPLFIGYNYERLEDYTNALKWYALSLQSRVEVGDLELEMILINVLERIIAIGENDPGSSGYCMKVLKKSLKLHPVTVYYLGRLHESGGDLENAASYYSEAIGSTDGSIRKKALDRIVENSPLLQRLNDTGLSNTRLLELLVDEGYWDDALRIAYLLPENKRTALVRALCHYKKQDYETSEALYKEYYSSYKDPGALKKLAFSSYYNGKRDLSYGYIKEYLSFEDLEMKNDIEALLLRHDLERSRLDLDSHLIEAEQLVRNHKERGKSDWVVQDAFYRAVSEGRYDTSIEFLKSNYRYMVNPVPRAWAMFVLGIYADESALKKAVMLSPGSYYYFRAAARIEVDTEILTTADRYYSRGMQERALQLYIQLYSTGYKKEYLRKKIVSILSTQEHYRPYFQIASMERGRVESALFDFLELGLYDELREIILQSYDWESPGHKMICDYLLSRIYYDTNFIYRGILYAERVVNGSETSSLLFLPREIQQLLYPRVYTGMIERAVPKNSHIPDDYFILAVIREESRYNTRARSYQGAVGLMQLLPVTASWIAGKDVSEEDLVDPAENITIGVQYLNYLFSRFDTLPQVLAAYNGGPNNVKRWLSRQASSDIDIFTEEIPFPETRNFVKKVIRSYNMYRELYEHDIQPDS